MRGGASAAPARTESAAACGAQHERKNENEKRNESSLGSKGRRWSWLLPRVASAAAAESSSYEAERLAKSKQCVDEGVALGVQTGLMTAVLIAIPIISAANFTTVGRRVLTFPLQALLISAGSAGAYFVTVDKAILACTRRLSKDDIMAKRNASQ